VLIRERNARISSDALPSVTANRRQLSQVLQNLMCNAIQHCQTDPVIHIDAVEGPTHWSFRVADNGPGIDEAQREKIFEPFKRLAQAQGLGLGLAICKKIVETHGGKIWCEVGAQKGATFVFTIPKDASAITAVTNTLSAEAAPAAPIEVEERPMANLLLVDDNEADIELTRIMLFEEAGLQCNLLVARDAYEAMSILRTAASKTGTVDLLLLEHLRAEESLRHMPVVMCTTSGYDKDMERAKGLGAMGYLTKPAEMNRLKPLLDRIETLDLRREIKGYTLVRAA
jgi:CheY-like chemotaxis protein